jgi:TolA-binding protein
MNINITKQKIALIVTILGLLIWVIAVNIPRYWCSEESNIQNYSEALEEYNNGDFQHSYYMFSKISRTSNLRQAAIYRQAQCAEHLNDNKTAIKKYKELMWFYPNSPLTERSRYLKAQDYYQSKKYGKAKRDFKNIVKKYPKTDYATASEYYLGAIEILDMKKTHSHRKADKCFNNASHYFRDYLKAAPGGRFAPYAIKRWTEAGRKLPNEDNLVIAKAYQSLGDFVNANKYLEFTDIGASWPYFVKNALREGNHEKVKFYTESGLKNQGLENISINEENSGMAENKEIYDAIDAYISICPDKKMAIEHLLNISQESNGYDYLLYKECNSMKQGTREACYNTLYTKFPDGQFAAESLSNIFYGKIKEKNYVWAHDIGRRYLAKYAKSNSTPKVMFWMGKLSERMKNYEDARSYYNEVISKYPDDYYAYRAFLNLNKYSDVKINSDALLGKDVVFPYKENMSNGLLIELADIQDYSLINELCKDDDFVQSWLAYQEGNFTLSAKLARDGMDKLDRKPERTDLRWRLVYPVHYYNEIRTNAFPVGNNPILILSIIKEESHFNAKVMSPVGAIGLMQLMPSTASEISRKYGVPLGGTGELFNPNVNIKFGNIYYSKIKAQLGYNDILAVLAYNGGKGAVSRWKSNLKYTDMDDFVEQIPYSETQTYLKKVYKAYWNYVRIYAED